MVRQSFCWYFFDNKTYAGSDTNGKNTIKCGKCGKSINYTLGSLLKNISVSVTYLKHLF